MIVLRYLFLTLGLAIAAWTPLLAQFNIFVGLTPGWSNAKVTNDIIDAFNEERPWLDKDMKQLGYIQGIAAGLRYRMEEVGFEFSYHNRFQSMDAEGINPMDQVDFSKDIYFTYQGMGLGIEQVIEAWSIGGSFGAEQLVMRAENNDSGNRNLVDRQYVFDSHFYFTYSINTAGFTKLTVKPFVQIRWQDFDLSPLAEELEVNRTGMNNEERYLYFGITLAFYNGG